MTITLHYHADRSALLDGATEDEAYTIETRYNDYIDYLVSNGFEIDRDSDQTTYCWSGADEWPADVQDFWAWAF